MQTGPFPIPDDVYIDPETGLGVNIPLGVQNFPGWWNLPEYQATVDRIMQLRNQMNFHVEDDYPFGNKDYMPPSVDQIMNGKLTPPPAGLKVKPPVPRKKT